MKIIDNYFLKLFHNFTVNPTFKTKSTILISNNNNKFSKQSKSIILLLNPLIYPVTQNSVNSQENIINYSVIDKPETQEDTVKESISSLDKKIEQIMAEKMEQIQEEKLEEKLLEELEKPEGMQKEESLVVKIEPQVMDNIVSSYNIIYHIKKYHSLYFILGLILFIKHK